MFYLGGLVRGAVAAFALSGAAPESAAKGSSRATLLADPELLTARR